MAPTPDPLAIALQHHQAGRLTEAEQLYREILTADPGRADAWHLLGVVAHQCRNHQLAVELIARAITLEPRQADYHCNLGAVRQALGDMESAKSCYHRAIELRPEMALAHSNLGNVHKELGQLEEAIESYQRALAIQPDLPLVHNNLAVALTAQRELEAAVAAYRRAVELKPDFVEAHSNLLYTLNFCPGYDAQRIYEEHRVWETRHALPLAKCIQPHAVDRSPDRPLRVGYVSPDFRQHPVGLFILPLLAHHDPRNFQIYGYASVVHSDEITERCRAHTQVWRDVLGQSDEVLAERIRDDQIDILVDLTMHMPGHRLLAFARKPAPVQVTYLAYCGTTGLGAIDYRLTDPYLDPVGGDDRYYAEKSFRLPETYWCYPDRGELPTVGPLPAEEAGHITFGCLNNFCKVTAPTVAAWMQLLIAVPQAQLILHAHPGRHRARLYEEFASQGISVDRLEFIDYLPTGQYLQTYNRIDIALDPFPLGGGTTTCDALWMGVPVISLAGETAVGRGGLSILSNVDLSELAAPDVASYIRLAIELAQDISRLAALRAGLRGRMRQSPLLDAPRFARHVEAAYRQMWHCWCIEPR
jgi:predicted O-linked N-acetylglucosamine transferase (SPINDLY family)